MISLLPMTQREFEEYFDNAVQRLAEDSIVAGNIQPDSANKWAGELLNKILSEGLNTPDHFFYSIVDDNLDKKVGYLRFSIREENNLRFPCLSDIIIFPAYRLQSYATHVMRLLEEKVQSLGFDEIKLHVYAHNHVAKTLYEKLGYRATNIQMTRKLSEN